MIMPNSSEPEKSTKSQKEACRIFKKILDNAQNHWDEFFYDHTSKLARGLLVTKEGVYPSELSYDDEKNYLSLVVRLRVNDNQSPTRNNAFLRFQNRCTQML